MADSAPALVERAAILTDLKRPAEAIRLLQRAVAAEPDGVSAWCELARAELAYDRPFDALHAANVAVGKDPAHEWPHRLASLALSRIGRHAEAVRAAREAVRLEPFAWQTYARLADALHDHPEPLWIRGQRANEAWAAALRAVELAPLEADAHCTLGHLLVKSGTREQAEAAFKEALRLDPHNAAALNGLGMAGMSSGPVAATADFAAALAADPDNPAARINISAVVWNVTRAACWVLFVLTFVYAPALLLIAPFRLIVAGVVMAALALLAVRARRRVPRRMQAYLWRLPRRNFYLVVTLALAAATCLFMLAAAVPENGDARAILAGLAMCASFASLMACWMGIAQHNSGGDLRW